MPPTRLLVIADAKMLPALTAGLREGGTFDVTPVALADRESALSASQSADAAVIFYGAAGLPLPATLQALAPQLRGRGARLVAVLQRNQAAMRDDCFRAGASDVLFMPIPKDQFIARLADCVALQLAEGPSAKAPLSISTRTSSSRIEQGAISISGVDALKELPLKAGETVRVAWDSFQHWGLVVRCSPSAQVRFAGLGAEDEAKIRAWLESALAERVRQAPAPTPSVTSRPRVSPAPAGLPAPAAMAPASDAAAPSGTADPKPPEMAMPPAPRAAPVSGPPPGFADRKPVRPARPEPAAGPAVGAASVTPAVPSRAPPSRPPASSAPAPPAPRTPAPPRAAAAVESASAPALFDQDSAATTDEHEKLPVWPTPMAPERYKDLLMQLLRDEGFPEGLAPAIVASAKKITSIMSAAERASLSAAGPDSAIPDALSARIALDSSTVEGAKLAVRVRTAAVDASAVAAFTKAADDAAARLQKSANVAIGKGEVEELQLITSVSASLSRDLLNFREMSDRLRGVGSGPRLGVGSLDPDVVLPGHPSRPRAHATLPAQQKTELRDFRGLDARPSRLKPLLTVALMAAAIAAAAHGFYFSTPRHAELSVAAAGEGVSHIDVSGDAALVTVTPDWVTHGEARLPRLLAVLRGNQVKKVALALPSGGTVGLLDVESGKIYGGPVKTGLDVPAAAPSDNAPPAGQDSAPHEPPPPAASSAPQQQPPAPPGAAHSAADTPQ